jgi:hypothetical protein
MSPTPQRYVGEQSYASAITNLDSYRIARAFRRDSPPTRSRRSEGIGGESSSMLTSVEGSAVQAFLMLL